MCLRFGRSGGTISHNGFDKIDHVCRMTPHNFIIRSRALLCILGNRDRTVLRSLYRCQGLRLDPIFGHLKSLQHVFDSVNISGDSINLFLTVRPNPILSYAILKEGGATYYFADINTRCLALAELEATALWVQDKRVEVHGAQGEPRSQPILRARH